jgi:copper resistance protein B
MGDDDPLLTMVSIHRLEVGLEDNPTPQRLEAQAWMGYDLNKVWLKSDIERGDSETESGDVEVLYGRAIAPFWDFQAGWKHDFDPGPSRDWFAVGFQGLAPYLFEVESTLYLGGLDRNSFELSAEYELLFTQRLILSPEIELIFNDYNDERIGAGSGLSSAEAGLRLRYEIRREFAPYLGIHWERVYGNTADFVEDEGDSVDELQLVVGFRAWF